MSYVFLHCLNLTNGVVLDFELNPSSSSQVHKVWHDWTSACLTEAITHGPWLPNYAPSTLSSQFREFGKLIHAAGPLLLLFLVDETQDPLHRKQWLWPTYVPLKKFYWSIVINVALVLGMHQNVSVMHIHVPTLS